MIGDGIELARAKLAAVFCAPPSRPQHSTAQSTALVPTVCYRVDITQDENMSFGSITASKSDYAVPSPPGDGVSDLSFSPNGTLLTAGSWDNGVSVYSSVQL